MSSFTREESMYAFAVRLTCMVAAQDFPMHWSAGQQPRTGAIRFIPRLHARPCIWNAHASLTEVVNGHTIGQVLAMSFAFFYAVAAFLGRLQCRDTFCIPITSFAWMQMRPMPVGGWNQPGRLHFLQCSCLHVRDDLEGGRTTLRCLRAVATRPVEIAGACYLIVINGETARSPAALLLAILQGQTIVNRMEWLDALVIGLTSFALAYRCPLSFPHEMC
mmetsp:Transcript_26570/g.61013  ORF Transcript_26570/g.61013 Transcript_26570/m.61013 type:complete len:219 (-) Transcript_26570:504-1160(-)